MTFVSFVFEKVFPLKTGEPFIFRLRIKERIHCRSREKTGMRVNADGANRQILRMSARGICFIRSFAAFALRKCAGGNSAKGFFASSRRMDFAETGRAYPTRRNDIRKVLPKPGLLSTLNVPLCCSITCLAMESPRPTPPKRSLSCLSRW